MNLNKARLIITLVAFVGAGLYVTFFSEPSRKRLLAKLQSATANEVINSLGQPYKIVDGPDFTARAKERADQGVPVSNADMTAKGKVWLYRDGKLKYGDVRRYRTVIFDEGDRVTGIYSTFWSKDPWGSSN
jgi:hypothetical protein